MISLMTVFWTYIMLFSAIGAFRGWAKEILVMFSLIVAMYINIIVTTYVEDVGVYLLTMPAANRFAIRAVLFIALALFGYQSPVISSGLGAKARREKFQDLLLGAGFGALNGYLLVGTLWFYLAEANYPISGITPPDPILNPEVIEFMGKLPPELLGIPLIHFVVGLVFVFLLVVFI